MSSILSHLFVLLAVCCSIGNVLWQYRFSYFKDRTKMKEYMQKCKHNLSP